MCPQALTSNLKPMIIHKKNLNSNTQNALGIEHGATPVRYFGYRKKVYRISDVVLSIISIMTGWYHM